jgi:hypothetical protein
MLKLMLCYVEDIVSLPLLPSETLEERIHALEEATPGLNVAQRLKTVLSSIIQPLDLDSMVKP